MMFTNYYSMSRSHKFTIKNNYLYIGLNKVCYSLVSLQRQFIVCNGVTQFIAMQRCSMVTWALQGKSRSVDLRSTFSTRLWIIHIDIMLIRLLLQMQTEHACSTKDLWIKYVYLPVSCLKIPVHTLKKNTFRQLHTVVFGSLF